MCVGDLNVILNIKHIPDMTLFFHQINLLLKRYSGVEWPRFIKQGSQINTEIKNYFQHQAIFSLLNKLNGCEFILIELAFKSYHKLT